MVSDLCVTREGGKDFSIQLTLILVPFTNKSHFLFSVLVLKASMCQMVPGPSRIMMQFETLKITPLTPS